MYQRISELLHAEGISLFAPIPLSACTIKKSYLLSREGITDGTAIMIAVPYYTEECEGATVSAYAVGRDYHAFFAGVFERIVPILKKEFPNNRFCGFADHSPISELHAAAAAGLGIIGKNSMLITEKYSSFVFLGELICDAHLDAEAKPIRTCENCGACVAACPAKNGRECLSAVTQKKGELTPSQIAYIREYGSAWGCDICQNVCPHTKRAKKSGDIYTDIPFFRDSAISSPSVSDIQDMSDLEFNGRAYSWRGRDCILRNLSLIGETKNKQR